MIGWRRFHVQGREWLRAPLNEPAEELWELLNQLTVIIHDGKRYQVIPAQFTSTDQALTLEKLLCKIHQIKSLPS